MTKLESVRHRAQHSTGTTLRQQNRSAARLRRVHGKILARQKVRWSGSRRYAMLEIDCRIVEQVLFNRADNAANTRGFETDDIAPGIVATRRFGSRLKMPSTMRGEGHLHRRNRANVFGKF